jgi:hypothetical protein
MLADVAGTAVALAVIAHRRAGIALARQWRALRSVLLAGAVAWGLGRAAAELADAAPPLLALVVSAAAALAAYLAVLALAEPAALRGARRQAGNALGSLRRPAVAADA